MVNYDMNWKYGDEHKLPVYIYEQILYFNHSKWLLFIRNIIICITKKENIFPFKFDTSAIERYIPISWMRNIEKGCTIELIKCGKLIYDDGPFSLVVHPGSTTEHIKFYLPAPFIFLFSNHIYVQVILLIWPWF